MGCLGADFYYVDNVGGVIVELADQGRDTDLASRYPSIISVDAISMPKPPRPT